MALLGRPTPEELAGELRIVIVAGLRAPKLRPQLARLPLLVGLASIDGLADSWATAQAIAVLISDAVAQLGDGPYGLSTAALFGTEAATRGLLKIRRRSAAAEELDTEVATFVRHWEPDMLLDVALNILTLTSSHAIPS